MKLWPGNPAESRARLQAIVDRELPRLRALEKTLRVQYEDPARAEAEDQALAQVTKEEMSLLRAERMHEQSYDRAVNALIKVRKQQRRGAGPGAGAGGAAGARRVDADPGRRRAWSVVRGAWSAPGDRETPAVRRTSSSPCPNS